MVKLHLFPREGGRDVISAVAFICYRCFFIIRKKALVVIAITMTTRAYLKSELFDPNKLRWGLRSHSFGLMLAKSCQT